MSDVDSTPFGFKWGPMEVERTSIKHDIHIVTVRPKQKGGRKNAVTISVSKAGQSVRVFKNGKELKVIDDD